MDENTGVKKSVMRLTRDQLREMLPVAPDDAIVDGKVTVGEIRSKMRERFHKATVESEQFHVRVMAEFEQRKAIRDREFTASLAAARERADMEFKRPTQPCPRPSAEVYAIREEVAKLSPLLENPTLEQLAQVDLRARELFRKYARLKTSTSAPEARE